MKNLKADVAFKARHPKVVDFLESLHMVDAKHTWKCQKPAQKYEKKNFAIKLSASRAANQCVSRVP